MRDDTKASAAMSEDPFFQGEDSPEALTTTDRLARGEVLRPGGQLPVLSKRDLLVVLGVLRESEALKRKAVSQWLSEHDPGPLLRASLERGGDLPRPPATLPA